MCSSTRSIVTAGSGRSWSTRPSAIPTCAASARSRMGLNLVDDPRKMALVSAIYQSLGAA
jgi:hypothetical protein